MFGNRARVDHMANLQDEISKERATKDFLDAVLEAIPEPVSLIKKPKEVVPPKPVVVESAEKHEDIRFWCEVHGTSEGWYCVIKSNLPKELKYNGYSYGTSKLMYNTVEHNLEKYGKHQFVLEGSLRIEKVQVEIQKRLKSFRKDYERCQVSFSMMEKTEVKVVKPEEFADIVRVLDW